MFHSEMHRSPYSPWATFASPYSSACTAFSPFSHHHGLTGLPFGMAAPGAFAPFYGPFLGMNSAMGSSLGAEGAMIRERLDMIQWQLGQLTEMLRRSTDSSSGGRGFPWAGSTNSSSPYPGNPYLHQAPGFEMSQCARLRESESLIFWEIFLPRLSMNDVDVEVSGNRIVCRTRVPLFPADRFWNFSNMPRGFEVFELPDGRAEFNWTVPVSFDAKEVEATWKEGYICICIPKSDVTERSSVQVTKESSGSRKGGSERQTHVS